MDEGTEVEGLKLPEMMEVKIDDGGYMNLPVSWDTAAYDSKPGVYVIEGTFILDNTIKNPKDIKTSITAEVKELEL